MAIVESPLSARFNQMVNDSAVAQRVVIMLQKLGIPDLVSIAAMSDDQWSAVLAFYLSSDRVALKTSTTQDAWVRATGVRLADCGGWRARSILK